MWGFSFTLSSLGGVGWVGLNMGIGTFFFHSCSIFFVGGRGLVGWSVFGGLSGFFPFISKLIHILLLLPFPLVCFFHFLSRMGWAFMGLIRWFLFCSFLSSNFLTSLTTTPIPIP